MRIAAITAAVIFVLDQLSKYAIVQGLNLIERGVIGRASCRERVSIDV